MADAPSPTRRTLLAGMYGLSGSLISNAAVATPRGDGSISPGSSNQTNASESHTGNRSGIVSVRDFGARGDSRTQDQSAFAMAATTLTQGGGIEVPAGEYRLGDQIFGPARGNIHAFDLANIGDDEIVPNGNFDRAVGRNWSMRSFSPRSGGVEKSENNIGSIATQLVISEYTTYLITIEVETAQVGGLAFMLAGEPIFTERDYSYIPAGSDTYQFAMFSYTVAGQTGFEVVADAEWLGIVKTLSIKKIEREVPYDFFSISADHKNFQNVQGIKFGRFAAGNITIGDRPAGAMFSHRAVWNISVGARTLSTNVDGFENTAIGAFALEYNQVDRNTAGGYSAFRYNTKGIQNTGWGYKTFGRNSVGSNNTGVGFWASMYNKTGGFNSSFGSLAAYYNCHGQYNSAFGAQAGMQNDGGQGNTFVGAISGPYTPGAKTFSYSSSTCIGSESKGFGSHTTAIGSRARCGSDPYNGGSALSTGATALGYDAVAEGDRTLAAGGSALAKGAAAVALGYRARADAEQAVAIGASASATQLSVAIGASAGAGLLGSGTISIGGNANARTSPARTDNCVAIGVGATNTESNQVVLGNTATRSICIESADLCIRIDKERQRDLKPLDPKSASAFISALMPASWQWQTANGALEGRIGVGFDADTTLKMGGLNKLYAASLIRKSDLGDTSYSPMNLVPVLAAALKDALDRIEMLEKEAARRSS